MSDYDHSIHNSPDAMRWATFFCETMKKLNQPAPDEDTMHGWFANAMMAMHDNCISRVRAEERAAVLGRLTEADVVEAALVAIWAGPGREDDYDAERERARAALAAVAVILRTPTTATKETP